MIRIGDVATIERNSVQPENIQSGTLYVGLENIESGGQFLNVRGVEKGELASSKFKFTSKHLLYGKLRPYLAKIALPSFDGICSTDILPIMPSYKLDVRYLKHYLCQQRMVDIANSLTTGANLPRLSPRALADLEIPLPALPEQRRIATILDKADEIWRKRNLAIAKLNKLAQSLFLEKFGDPVSNPKGWTMCSVSELLHNAEVFVDGDWVESKDQDPDGEVRLIQLADIGDGFYIDKSNRFLTKKTAMRLKCTFLKKNDVLIARMPDPLGRACLFPGDEKESVTVVDVCVVRPSEDGPDPSWLMHCINSAGFRSLIAAEATGATRVRISRGNLSRLPIIAPPIEEQRNFAQAISTIDRIGNTYRRSRDTCEAAQRSLQRQMLQPA